MIGQLDQDKLGPPRVFRQGIGVKTGPGPRAGTGARRYSFDRSRVGATPCGCPFMRGAEYSRLGGHPSFAFDAHPGTVYIVGQAQGPAPTVSVGFA